MGLHFYPYQKNSGFAYILRRSFRSRDRLSRLGWFPFYGEDLHQTKLSKKTDRLPAISSVAEKFAPSIQSDYLAGLWRRYLVYDLMWRADEFTTPKLSKSGCPSWSWAAMKGEITFQSSGLLELTDVTAEIVDCRVTLVSDKVPFGAVTGGKLVVPGVSRRVANRQKEEACSR